MLVLILTAMLFQSSIALAVIDNVKLPECTNPNDIMDLQKLLSSYHYTIQYDKKNFNCVDFTTACLQFLEKKNYKTAAMAHIKNPTSAQPTGHVYPIVQTKSGWIAVEASSSDTSNFELGYVVDVDRDTTEYHYLNGVFINNSTELRDYDGGPAPIYTGDLTRFIARNGDDN